MRRYLSVPILVCALAGAQATQRDTRTSADLPGPVYSTLQAPPNAPTWVRSSVAIDPPAPLPTKTPGSFELIGHDPLLNRGMNSAIAVYDHYVYVGSRTDGTHADSDVLVVDVKDPSKPAIVNRIGAPDEANPGESSRELRVMPEQGLLLVLNHGCSELIHRCANATQASRNVVKSNIKFYDVRGDNAAAPKLVATYFPTRTEAQTPHEFFLWNDPQRPGRVLMYETTPSTQASAKNNLYVVDLSHARENKFTEISNWNLKFPDATEGDTRLHSLTLSYDGRRAYFAYLGGGFMVADTSDFADAKPSPEVRLITRPADRPHWGDPGAHSAIQLPGRPWVMTTDEVYGKLGGLLPAHGCPWGWPRFIDISDPERPRVAADYKLAMNDAKICPNVPDDQDNVGSYASHNPTLTPHLAILTWHAAGLQAIDLSDPSAPKAAASYVPEPLPVVQTEDPALTEGRDKVAMWSFPIVKDGLIYAVDLRNGLYILRYHGPFEDEISKSAFLDGNSNAGDVGRLEKSQLARNEDTAILEPGSAGGQAPSVTVGDCLAQRMRFGTRALGVLALRATLKGVSRRAGRPQRVVRNGARWCVAGGGRAGVALAKGRVVLAGARPAIVKVPKGARRLGKSVRVKRGRFYLVRGKTVLAAGVTSLRTSRAILRAARIAGLR